MKRGSRIARVLNFFRTGDKDEIRAVLLILAHEGLAGTLPEPKVKAKRGRKARLNGADSLTSTQSNTMEASA
jgi:hypothetical protein